MFGQKGGSRPTRENSPYQEEWESLMDAIKNDKPYNEVERGVQASVVTSMGRMSAHLGTEVTYDQMLHSDHVFGPGVANLTLDSESPLLARADGTYPVPEPGIKNREY